jgi:hypothetical protein
MSTTTTSSTFQKPLSQVLQLINNDTILVTDSVSCDGRFVLYTIAADVLNNTHRWCNRPATIGTDTKEPNGNPGVLWISCTSTTDESILNTLKKIGCDKTLLSSACVEGEEPLSAQPNRLSIFSVINQFEVSLMNTNVFNEENFMKSIFQQIKLRVAALRNSNVDPICVVLDDVFDLAALVGGGLVYALLISLISLKSSEKHQFGLFLRSSNDADLRTAGKSLHGMSTPEWLDGRDYHLPCTTLSWEQGILELADTIIDIAPLRSGYSREVHGRLTFSRRSPETISASYNYCLNENQVSVMHLT